jgi:hypothetical protein
MALGTSAAVAGVVGLAQNDPSAQQRVDGLFTALGQSPLDSGALILGGQAEDAVAGVAVGQASASRSSPGNSVLLGSQTVAATDKSEARRALFAALAQEQGVGASAGELSAGNDSDLPADLWWLRYGQG